VSGLRWDVDSGVVEVGPLSASLPGGTSVQAVWSISMGVDPASGHGFVACQANEAGAPALLVLDVTTGEVSILVE
jgi:hypothetical protein